MLPADSCRYRKWTCKYWVDVDRGAVTRLRPGMMITCHTNEVLHMARRYNLRTKYVLLICLIVLAIVFFWPNYRIWPEIDATDVFWNGDKLNIVIVERTTTYHGCLLHEIIAELLIKDWNRRIKYETFIFEVQDGKLHGYRYKNLRALTPCTHGNRVCFYVGTHDSGGYYCVRNGGLIPLTAEDSRMLYSGKAGMIDESWKSLHDVDYSGPICQDS
jgi:hypothetical protein